jgi:hypothetical protein
MALALVLSFIVKDESLKPTVVIETSTSDLLSVSALVKNNKQLRPYRNMELAGVVTYTMDKLPAKYRKLIAVEEKEKVPKVAVITGKKGKSAAVSHHPLAQALSMGLTVAKKTYGKGSKIIQPSNPQSRSFFERYGLLLGDLKLIPEMKSIIHPDAKVVKEFIASNGKTGKTVLDVDRTECNIGALFELFLKWKEKGSSYPVKGDKYAGVRITGVQVVDNKVLCIPTKSGDTVYLMEHAPIASSDLMRKAEEYAKKFPSRLHSNVIGFFPKVNLHTNEEYKWVHNTWLGTGPSMGEAWRVVRCNADNILKMDEVGAYVKSSVHMTMMTKSAAPKPKEFKIEGPFIMWVMRKSCQVPIFAAYVDVDSWVKK